MSNSYKSRGEELFQHYHKKEIDETLDKATRESLMIEWWQKTYDIIIDENLSQAKLEQILNDSVIAFRSEFDVFLSQCKQLKLPFLIILVVS